MGIFKGFIQKIKREFPQAFTRQWLFDRGLMFGAIILGMILSFPLQFFAPLPKDGWLFLQQSFGFGLLFGGLGAFMMSTFISWSKDIFQGTRQTLNSDKAMFLGVLLSFFYIFVMIDTYGAQNPILKYTGMLSSFITFTFNQLAQSKNDGSASNRGSGSGGGSGGGRNISTELRNILKSSEFSVR